MTDESSAAARHLHVPSSAGRDAHTDADDRPMFFERRRHRRHAAGGRVTAVITGPGHAEAVARRICSLQLSDLSTAGVGAMVQEPLPIGATLTVFCPPHGPEPGFDLHGTIVRCEPDDWGYRLGIRLDARMAA
ncbi:MAG: PilZ domain-containing protein [Phycisphaeraceae bacterium]